MIRQPKEILFLGLIIWSFVAAPSCICVGSSGHKHLQPTFTVRCWSSLKMLLPTIIVNFCSRKTADWFRKLTCEQPVAAFCHICIFMSARLFDTGGAAVTSGPDLPHMMFWIIKQRIVRSSSTPKDSYDLCHYKIRHCSDSQPIMCMQRQLYGAFVFYCFISSKKSHLETSCLIWPSY